MTSLVLPAAHDAALALSSGWERTAPSSWPGTYCPNFSDWRLGDIVLVHGARGLSGLLIRAAQQASLNRLSRLGSIVSHAGIYVGNGMLVDARYGEPVSERSVWQYCQSRPLRLRRLRNDGSLPSTAGDDIAAAARLHIGEPYSVLAAILSKVLPRTTPKRRALYCSTLVGLVVSDATGVNLSSDIAHRPLHPAVLAAHPDLEDVLLEWRHL